MAPLETLERVKLPLRSVTVPFLVPFTTTVAPIIISPFASLTTPRQVCCCWTICVEMPAYANVLAEEAASIAHTVRIKVFCITIRSEEHTSELQSRQYLVCRL